MGSCYSNLSETSIALQRQVSNPPVIESKPPGSSRHVRFEVNPHQPVSVEIDRKPKCDQLKAGRKRHQCLSPAECEIWSALASPKRKCPSLRQQKRGRRIFRRIESALQRNRRTSALTQPPNWFPAEGNNPPDPEPLVQSYQVSFVPEVLLVEISDSSDDEENSLGNKIGLWQGLLTKTTRRWKRSAAGRQTMSSSSQPGSQLKPPSAYGSSNQSNNAAPPSSNSHFAGAKIISSGFVRKTTEQFQRRFLPSHEPPSDNTSHSEATVAPKSSKLPLLGALKSRIPHSRTGQMTTTCSSKSTGNVNQGYGTARNAAKHAGAGDRSKIDSSSCTDLAKPVSLSAASSNSSVSSQPPSNIGHQKAKSTAAAARAKSSSSSSLEQQPMAAGAGRTPGPGTTRTATITGGPVAQRPQIVPVTPSELSNLPPPDLNRIGIPLMTTRPRGTMRSVPMLPPPALSRQQQSRLHFLYGSAAGAPSPPPVPSRPTTTPRLTDQRLSAISKPLKMAYNGERSSPLMVPAPLTAGSLPAMAGYNAPYRRPAKLPTTTVTSSAALLGTARKQMPAGGSDMYRTNTEDLNGNFLPQPAATLEDFFGKDKTVSSCKPNKPQWEDDSVHRAGDVSVSSSMVTEEEEELSTCSSVRTDELHSKLSSWNAMSASLCSTASTASSFVFDGRDQSAITTTTAAVVRGPASRVRNASSQSRSTTGGDSTSSCSNRDLFLIDDEIADQPGLLLFTGPEDGRKARPPNKAAEEDWLVSPTKTLTPSTSITSTVTHTSSDSPVVSAGIGNESMIQSLNELESLIMRTNMVDYQSLPCFDGQHSSGNGSKGSSPSCASQSPASGQLRKRHSYTQSSGHPVPVFRRPRPLSFVENDDGSVGLDSPSFRAVSQDLIGIKTLLFRLQNVLQNAETQNPFEKPPQRASYDSSERSTSTGTPADIDQEAAVQGLREENFDLRQHVLLLEQQLIEKERTIRLLQQQMVKYTVAAPGFRGGQELPASPSKNAATQTEFPNWRLPPDVANGGHTINRNAR